MEIEKIKKIAVLYKNIFIEKGSTAYAERYKQDVEFNVFSDTDIVLIHTLAEVYVDVRHVRK